MMDAYDFLKRYETLQKGIMVDELFDLTYSTVGFCSGDSSPYWNHALTNSVLSSKQIKEIESRFTNLKRNPAVYFENTAALYPLMENLSLLGYKKKFEDSWLFYQKHEVDTRNFSLVKMVENTDMLEIFLRTFDGCYQIDDPMNPYGELGEYLIKAKDVWGTNREKLFYYIVFKDNTPVAVSSLTSLNGLGYISNIGSLPEVRGQGFGKLATFYCIQQSMIKGNTYHFLATEEGTHPDEFYKNIGFEKLFSAVGYIKEYE